MSDEKENIVKNLRELADFVERTDFDESVTQEIP